MKYIIYRDGWYLSNSVEDGMYWTDRKQNAARFTRETAEQTIIYYPGSTIIQVH